jgi:hypothetical protein
LDLKHLLKRGALLAAANWPVIAIQCVAQITFSLLLAVPIMGAAILLTLLLDADLDSLLQGGIGDMVGAIARALAAEPVALAAFIVSFGLVLVGGSMFTFLVKGGTVSVLLDAAARAGAIEREPLTWRGLRSASVFSLERFADGCARLLRPYTRLGLLLMAVYALSGAAALGVIVVGYRAAGGWAVVMAWTLALVTAVGLVLWITIVNLTYLLVQIALASGAPSVRAALQTVARFVRAEFRELAGVVLVMLAVMVGAMFASALAWSGVGLVAFIPLIGLAVFPLQLAAEIVRRVVFEYIGITALGAYSVLYQRRTAATRATAVASPSPGGAIHGWG